IREDPETLRMLGIAQARFDRYADAEVTLRRALDLDPTSQIGVLQLGTLLLDAGRQLEAEKEFRRAVEMHADAHAWWHLGVCLWKQQQIREGEECLRKAVEVDRKYVGAWVSLGDLLEESRRTREAVDVYREGLVEEPQSHPLWFELTECLTNNSLPGAEEAA